jgi:hypothetical protein
MASNWACVTKGFFSIWEQLLIFFRNSARSGHFPAPAAVILSYFTEFDLKSQALIGILPENFLKIFPAPSCNLTKEDLHALFLSLSPKMPKEGNYYSRSFVKGSKLQNLKQKTLQNSFLGCILALRFRMLAGNCMGSFFARHATEGVTLSGTSTGRSRL